MNTDGSDQINLTDNFHDDSFPVWSPDGKRIAFVSDRDGNSDIYVMDATGNNQVNLTDNPAEDVQPLWPGNSSHSRLFCTLMLIILIITLSVVYFHLKIESND
jgi:dipeptidyl aminopeptidase/acylaminoacyl peptidase